MDKTQALERLTALETEAAALRKIIEAPETSPSLLTKPVSNSGVTFGSLDTAVSGRLVSASRVARGHWTNSGHANFFQSESLASAYAEALDTFLLLRHQPGTVPAEDGFTQWVILVGSDRKVRLDSRNTMHFKIVCLSPCFNVRGDAQRAIDAVGERRILHMFRTFHHVTETL